MTNEWKCQTIPVVTIRYHERNNRMGFIFIFRQLRVQKLDMRKASISGPDAKK
ncbi:hypothetical protein VRK_38410 [Vibrio sp. MEBiC08052]|nr:hypothetical protein VRK_38410 [Vibrio sp. MEBiC08052]